MKMQNKNAKKKYCCRWPGCPNLQDGEPWVGPEGRSGIPATCFQDPLSGKSPAKVARLIANLALQHRNSRSSKDDVGNFTSNGGIQISGKHVKKQSLLH